MATYEAGVFKDKHYDTLLDAQNDPTIEDRMTCFIAGKLYYKFGGVFQEVKMEIHNGIYLDLITVGSPEVPNPIVGVPYLFYDPDAVTYYLMVTAGDGTFWPIPFDARFLLKESSILGSLIESDAIATHHIINQNITTEKYAYNSIIGYNHIQSGSIQNEQLAAHSVGTNNYSPYSITSGAIGNGEVKNANIDTGAVTNSKIANGVMNAVSGQLAFTRFNYTGAVAEGTLTPTSNMYSYTLVFSISAERETTSPVIIRVRVDDIDVYYQEHDIDVLADPFDLNKILVSFTIPKLYQNSVNVKCHCFSTNPVGSTFNYLLDGRL
jgi:hypothetical protein